MSAVEMGDVVRRYGRAFLERFGARVRWHQLRALIDISRCRTAAMGGHVEACTECGLVRCAYNSCRNRHCPTCLGFARRRWAQAREDELLPVPYFHLVFTLPHELADLALSNPRTVYDILFKASAATLKEVAADEAHLGAKIGFISVLHTWGQKLGLHPHIHCLVPGGGLSPDGQRWIASRDNFFLPVRVLSRVFRGKCLAMLRQAHRTGRLSHRSGRRAVGRRLAAAGRHEWVVYSKPPFGGPIQVVRYLARYTHRVAISNHRILGLTDGRVTFRYRDYADDNRTKEMSLPAVEFIRRFLMHVLPPGFTRIRHYGFLANRHRRRNIQLCRTRIAEASLPETAHLTPSPPEPVEDAPAEQRDPQRCPGCCVGTMQLLRTYPRPVLAPEIHAQPSLAWDTS